MKLLDLYIKGFGKFHNQSFSFEDGLNIVYGKNEAGKSTLHTFIRGMLFGIEKQRGRASKNDLYTKFEPWENSGTYEGQIRLEHNGTIYRIERSFQKNKKEMILINETLGKEIEPTKAVMDDILGGLSETSYNNTISIGQLKSATDAGMISELKNYIANMNTTGNMALNITKATTFLKNQRKEFETQIVSEAALSYTTLLSEIRNIEKEIASPEYENQMKTYQSMKSKVQLLIEEKQKEKEKLLQKAAQGRQLLTGNQFTDLTSIQTYSEQTEETYRHYQAAEAACQNKTVLFFSFFFLLLGIISFATGLIGYSSYSPSFFAPFFTWMPSSILFPIICGSGGLMLFLSLILFLRMHRHKKDYRLYVNLLQEIFTRHLGDGTVSEDAMGAFRQRMAEFERLEEAISRSESEINKLAAEIIDLQSQQNACSEVIEKQQRSQWELEKKLERLASCRTQAESLKHVLEENDRIREEIAAIDLAKDTMTELSTSIRDSFGLYLNKTASELIDGITGGIYNSMSIDENLNVFMNTRTKLVPVDQVSSGTMDQIYLALRLAAAHLIQKKGILLPLIFDDSFVLYDDERLKVALKWLVKAYKGQIIIFTCHQREAQLLTANQIPYHLVNM